MVAWYIGLGALAALAAIYPWELGAKADPFASAPAGIKPEWYFLFAFQTLKLVPSKILSLDGEVLGILAFGLVGALWLLLPFLEPRRLNRGHRVLTGAGVFALTFIVAMTVYGWVAR